MFYFNCKNTTIFKTPQEDTLEKPTYLLVCNIVSSRNYFAIINII